jgi:signal transduction histidine kinase
MYNFILTPIVTEEKIIGIVLLGKTVSNYFAEEHVKWAEALVGQATVAIQNAWLFEQVRAGRERLQSLSRRLVEVQETERRFISRELHDHAGQTLTCLILGLGALEREADEPQKVRTQIGELKNVTHNVLKDLHRLAVSLRPASLDQLGLVSALEQLVESFTQNSPLQIRFKAVGICEDDRLPHEVETTLYRIAQEALTNVIRHAGARRADVVLERRDDIVLILVEDDGKGFDVDGAKMAGPLGLLGMQERAEMLGGTLTVESNEGRGTTLVVEVPYGNPHNARG